MPAIIEVDRLKPSPSIVAPDLPALSDDECLERLARAIAAPDSDCLDEVARLIGRLAVIIE
ncbi:MAG: hypothetical protein JOZ74_08455 [Bradyrhizobium sp.]|nr:hypothetical protein [Bradyrhizobium sp.]